MNGWSILSSFGPKFAEGALFGPRIGEQVPDMNLEFDFQLNFMLS